ncbi:hypothetical protein [Streptomyces fagopyri]|uniref:hypothetical protein n=1 Tax=Streptomyces fagopyri TaxID=2662397 RepID=UPI0033F7FCE2
MAAHPITAGRPGERTSGTGTLTGAEITRGLAGGDERCPAAAYHRWGGPARTTARRSLGDARETLGVSRQVGRTGRTPGTVENRRRPGPPPPRRRARTRLDG